MKKLVQGIVEFRKNVLPSYREKFSRLALGQSPDTLFIACSDSRVVPNTFASTDPGDLFVIRNVGNLIPCCDENGHSVADESEAAAIELAILKLNVKNIIVCGHSECAAMKAILDGREKVDSPHLKAWLRHGEDALKRLSGNENELNRHNRLSQLNILQQLEHLMSYTVVKDRVVAGQLKLHGWWFELTTANVYAYDESVQKFILIDEKSAPKIMEHLS